MKKILLKKRSQSDDCPNCGFSFAPNLIETKEYRLSLREAEIIRYLTRGKTAREIAETTSLSRRTIEHYIENIKIKLKVKKKSELIEKALELVNETTFMHVDVE